MGKGTDLVLRRLQVGGGGGGGGVRGEGGGGGVWWETGATGTVRVGVKGEKKNVCVWEGGGGGGGGGAGQ